MMHERGGSVGGGTYLDSRREVQKRAIFSVLRTSSYSDRVSGFDAIDSKRRNFAKHVTLHRASDSAVLVLASSLASTSLSVLA